MLMLRLERTLIQSAKGKDRLAVLCKSQALFTILLLCCV